MFNERQMIKLGILAERAHRLAFDIALQSARLGEHGMAIIADETRNIGNKIYDIFDSNEINGAEMLDAVSQLKYLSVNGYFELRRISNETMQAKSTKPLAVIFDEIRNLTNDIEKFFGVEPKVPYVIPRVAKRHPVIGADLYCIAYSIEGSLFVENTQYVQEVLKNGQELQVREGHIQLRNTQVPIVSIDSFKKPTDSYQAVIILGMSDDQNEDRHALFVDDLPDIFVSKSGVSSEYRGELPSKYVRECWDAEEGLQMVFLSPYTLL